MKDKDGSLTTPRDEREIEGELIATFSDLELRGWDTQAICTAAVSIGLSRMHRTRPRDETLAWCQQIAEVFASQVQQRAAFEEALDRSWLN